MITGASAGIGTATAWGFAALGAKLILLGRRKDRLDALKAEITKQYPQVIIGAILLPISLVSDDLLPIYLGVNTHGGCVSHRLR